MDRDHGYVFDDLRPSMTVRLDLVFNEQNRPQARHVGVITEM